MKYRKNALRWGAVAVCSMNALTLSYGAFADVGTKSDSAATTTGKDKKSGELTDAQITTIVITANNADIDAGHMAKAKIQSPEVRDLAEHMVKDHTASNNQIKSLGIKKQESDASKDLKKEAADNRKDLAKTKPDDFDKKYVEQEVNFHQQVLNTIDNTLMPNAKSETVKETLTKTRPVIQMHLAHAKTVQKDLEKQAMTPKAGGQANSPSKESAGTAGTSDIEDTDNTGNSSPAGQQSGEANQPSS